MNDRVFIDSNILIYAYSEEERKREKALDIIKTNESVISIQVINEFVNVVKKKFNKENDEILEALHEIEEQLVIWDNLNLHLTKKAINLSEKYQYSYYDCLIIAAALEAKCSILYTEDMHHNHLIEGKLRITNPFHILPLEAADSLLPVENDDLENGGNQGLKG
jgi:predicted nucleic acid-binding protein